MQTNRLLGAPLALALLLLFGPVGHAQPVIPDAALKIVVQQLPVLCQGISTTTTTQGYELTGSAKAGLSSTFSKLANAGFQGAAKYRSEKSEGLAAKDLAAAIANGNNCRLAVLNFFSPYLLPEKRRQTTSAAPLPFSAQKVSPLISLPAGNEQTAVEISSLRAQLADANAKIQQLSAGANGAAAQLKSPILRINDGDKFHLVKTLRGNMVNARSERLTCHVMVHSKPRGIRTDVAWGELSEIIGTAGWSLEGGRVQQTFFPDGFTLAVSSDGGDGFTCGYQLQQLLLTLNVPVRFVDKQVIPDLITCEKEDPTQGCVAISVGDFK